MTTTQATCPLCEAICGIVVEHDGGVVRSVRGDGADPFSRGYICPKAAALQDLHTDPDRVKTPLRRVGSRWTEVSWDEALAEAGERIAKIQTEHGRDAAALYYGNPTAHSYGAVLSVLGFSKVLRTRSVFSANSVDSLPRLFISSLLFGSQALQPIPDIDRTSFMLVVGANPVVSNGSIMTAPDCKRRLERLRARGGRLVVVDPRRTETAEIADEHRFIRPGTDALLLAALLHTVLSEGLARPDRLAPFLDGFDRLAALVEPFAPERVAGPTGIGAEDIRKLARDFAAAPSAVCYGRMGTSTQEFGTVSTWLIDLLNIATGNLDREGGVMFTTPAVDLAGLAAALGQTGKFGRWRSRVRGLPEFNGELPVATLAEEIETPGRGRIRALVTHAGNPALSAPNGRRIERALASLDFMVSIDIYKNETTRHAHLILPPTVALEHDSYPLLFHGVAVRNTAKYSRAVLDAPPGVRHDWEILLGLGSAVASRRSPLERVAAGAANAAARAMSPRDVIALGLRTGPHRKRVSLADLERTPEGVDLGPLEPKLPRALATPNRRIPVAPGLLVEDLRRLERRLETLAGASIAGERGRDAELLLVGRRQLRSNNSWMHNSLRLVKGPRRCTLLLHPEDARARGIATGDRARVRSRVGEVVVEVEVTDTIMPGVASLPHGWGHDREGADLSVARAHAGVSANDLTDDHLLDAVTGCASLSAVPVRVERAVVNEAQVQA